MVKMTNKKGKIRYNFALAFGNKLAKVDTTPLNRRATYASALPTTTLQVASGTPIKDKEKNRQNPSDTLLGILAYAA